MEANSNNALLDMVNNISAEVSSLKDLFLRRLIDDKVKVAAIEKLSANNEDLIDCLNQMHFESFVQELILICDRIDAKQDISDFESSIRDELLEAFSRRGVHLIPPEQVFDPAIHNAIKAIPSSEECPPGTIVATLRAGYMINDRVLRPADVIVSSNRVK